MEYEKGTYSIFAQKEWECQVCHHPILQKTKYFARITIAENGFRNYFRIHFKCAKSLIDLNDYERDLIKENLKFSLSERELQTKVDQLLRKLEKQKLLSYLRISIGMFLNLKGDKKYKIGRAGFSDYVIFLKGGESIFVELKDNKKLINENQQRFQQVMKNLNFNYYIVTTISELWYILKEKIDIPNPYQQKQGCYNEN